MIRLGLLRNIVFFNGIIFFALGLIFDLGLAQSALSVSFLISVFWVLFSVKKSTISEHLFFLFVSLLPIINFSKGGFFFYNIISVILFTISAIYISQYGIKYFVGSTGGISSNILTLSCSIYFFSVINMGRYDSNLKIFELILTAILFARIIKNRYELLALTKLLSLTSISLVLFLLLKTAGNSNRLMVNAAEYLNDGIDIGGSNPINYGLPIVFCLLIYLIFGPFAFRKRVFLRSAVPIILVISLLLTTSRGSLLVLALSFVIYLVLTKKIQILVYTAATLTGGYYIFYILAGVYPEFAASFDFLITRTQELDDVNQISQGRLEQWIAMYEYITKNFTQMIFGFGPGNQYFAHSVISSVLDQANTNFFGREFAYHALILRLVSELGLLGLSVYILLFLQIAKKAWINAKSRYEFHFMTFLFGWFAIGLSVSSFDAFSGLFLGMSMSSISIKT